MGIYRYTENYSYDPDFYGQEYELIDSLIVKTDDQGNLLTSIKANYPEGSYFIVVGAKEDDEVESDEMFSIYSSSLSNNSPASIKCSGAPSTRLNIGFRARVTHTDGTPGSVRSAPASSQVLGKVPEGTRMDIVGGPRYNNSRIWWEVETDNGYEGWISEGKIGGIG